ncbi:MAG: energy transducer TonB, partial [Prevotella sp.]|nr:energy transducer TonB [Prevotella sp.]
VMPSYEGGMPALMTFLAQNVRYPKIAQSNGVSGRVIVQFVVEKDGHVTDVHVVKSKIDKPVAPKTEEKAADTNDGNAGASAACTVVSYSVGTNDGNAAASTVSEEDYAQSVKALEDEAVRVVNMMRSWKPGKQNGAPVRVKFCVPLTFRLN